MDVTREKTARMMSVNVNLVCRVFRRLEDACSLDIERNPFIPFGGTSVIKCDESKFNHKAKAVYDWVGHSDDRPLFFTLHGGGGVKRLEDPVEGHCVLHLQEREEEEMLSLLGSEVSLRGSLPKGTEDLSSTLPDERRDDDAIRDVGPSEAKRPKWEADVTEKGENNEKTKKKRKRRKKAKNVAGNDGKE